MKEEIGMKYVKLLLIVLVVLAVAVGVRYLKPFETLSPSASITVLDLNSKPIPGAILTIDEIDRTFHYLGDVFNWKTMSAGMDGVVDSYDLDYIRGIFGQPDINWADLNKDGTVDLYDVIIISANYGLVRTSYPANNMNVTNTDGKCTFDIVYTSTTDEDNYVITASAEGYQNKTVIRNLKYPQTIYLEPQEMPGTPVPIPNIYVLTVLSFPPSETVNVQVYVTDQGGNAMANTPVVMTIFDSAGTALRQSSSVTGVDGKATILITTPPSSGKYNATFTVDTTTVSKELTVLPKILITPTGSYQKVQIYKPGDFDFTLEVTVSDTDQTMLTGFSVEKSLTDVASGTAVSAEYVSFVIQGSRIIYKAKLYDWYKMKDPAFSYNEKVVKVVLKVSLTNHITNTFSDLITMKAPQIIALVPSSITSGATGITISFRDPYGNVPSITKDNVEVIIQTPSGKAYSTMTELADKTILSHGDMSIAFTFSERGTYKITIKYYNFPWEQPTATYNVNVTEASQPISLLTNPYFLGIIAIIVIAILLRRRKKQ